MFIRQATIFNRHSYSLLQADEHAREGKGGSGGTLDKLHHSMNLRNSFLYFFTVESALDLNNIEGKSFKSDNRRTCTL